MKVRPEGFKEYEPVIGLEVHIQLKTESKLFCSCPVEYNIPPNKNVCPQCLGLPGTLPVLNRRAVELAIIAAKRLNCTINKISAFARKHYFYPDFPKGYQITQYDRPLAQDGYLTISNKKISIRRIHLEEDTARLLYKDKKLLIDFNRAGIPLIEVVTEPIIGDTQIVERFLRELRIILVRLGVSEANMARGQMRCEPNISIRSRGEENLGPKVEIKNINSFANVREAMRCEIERQIGLLRKGKKVIPKTMGWDDKKKMLVPLRTKEKSADYRYFPEPDLPLLKIDDDYIKTLDRSIDVLMPDEIRKRLKKLGIPSARIETIININGYEYFSAIKEYYERITKKTNDTGIINFLTTEVLGYLNVNNLELSEFNIPAQWIAELLAQVAEKKITSKTAKDIFNIMVSEHRSPEEIIKVENLIQIEDPQILEQTVDMVIRKNPEIVQKIRRGKIGAIGVLVGYVMKTIKGRLNPKDVGKKIEEKILKGNNGA